jgi:hypothetical protein
MFNICCHRQIFIQILLLTAVLHKQLQDVMTQWLPQTVFPNVQGSNPASSWSSALTVITKWVLPGM